MAEIVVVGAGPAGMAAAISAASCDARVVLLDDNQRPGGQIWRGGNESVDWFRRLRQRGIRVLSGARVVSAERARRTLTVETRDRAFTVRFEKLILATGARELFIPFPGWTMPKVFGAGGLQALAKSGFSLRGKRIVVAGTGPFLLAAAAYFRSQGATVPVIAEQTSQKNLVRFSRQLVRFPGKLTQAVNFWQRLRGTRYLSSCWIEQAREGLVTLRRDTRVWEQPNDFLAVGYGFVPNVELAALLGCEVEHHGIQVNNLQQTSREDIYAAGECTGIGGVDLSLVEGQMAGFAASGQVEKARRLDRELRKYQRFARVMSETFSLRPELRNPVQEDTMICRCEDVRFGALREMHSRREAKLHTRCGMGACQGRVCGPILDFLTFPDTDSVRPPIFPVRLETLTTREEFTER